jgi:hypothetical protein
MQETDLLLLGLAAFVYARSRSADTTRLPRLQHLKGWQKLFGALAAVMALVILFNPELLALGLLADTALLDMLVLALSLQLQASVARAWHSVSTVPSWSLQWLFTPRLGPGYLLTVAVLGIGKLVSATRGASQSFES